MGKFESTNEDVELDFVIGLADSVVVRVVTEP